VISEVCTELSVVPSASWTQQIARAQRWNRTKLSSSSVGKLFRFLTKATSEEKEKIEHELPFAVMIFTLMAASGISSYDSWKRMRKLTFLPTFKKEADEVIRQVEVLGKDPLTVMHNRGEMTNSKLYRNFLGGFVSSVRSGGKIVDYMRSELKTVFELRNIAMTHAIEKIATLVEAYAVMLIVTLCAYILFVVFSSTSILELSARTSIPNSPITAYLIAFLFMPILSFVFILVAHNMQRSAFPDLKDVYKKAIILIVAIGVPLCLILLVPSFSFINKTVGMAELVTVGLVAISLPLAVQYYKIARINYNAEDAIPNFIRDVTETQKIGLSPEKSIIQATKRKDYGQFSQFLELVRSQIEWGIPLRKTFENIRQKIRSWFVIVNFAMMIETIEIGGNSTQALEILSEYSEKEREVQINRRALLRPYVILAFVWSVLIAVTTTIVALTTYMMSTIVSSSLAPVTVQAMQNQMKVFSTGIILQCWISGFFIGKISEGNFAAGFKHSAMLAVTAYVSLVLSQSFLASAFGISVAT
jgi:flagellar protein FlaJ